MLLHKIGETELSEWVNFELTGYPTEDQVPPYRNIHSEPIGTVSNGIVRHNDMALPIGHLSSDKQEYLTKKKLKQPIAEIETLIASGGDSLATSIPPEFWSAFTEPMSAGFGVESAHCRISTAQLKGIPTNIRSRLLDFLLKLDQELPEESEPSDMTQQGKQLDVHAMFQSAMFGANTTIIFGSNNTTGSNAVVSTGDLNQLMDHLKSLKVDDQELESLAAILAKPSPPQERAEEASHWSKSVATRLAESVLQIEVGTIAGILSQAISQYLGL